MGAMRGMSSETAFSSFNAGNANTLVVGRRKKRAVIFCCYFQDEMGSSCLGFHINTACSR